MPKTAVSSTAKRPVIIGCFDAYAFIFSIGIMNLTFVAFATYEKGGTEDGA